jgi:hypothetical protein
MAFRLTLNKGDDRKISFDWDTDITGATITFTLKSKATDTAAIISKSTATSGITITNASLGQGTVDFDEADFNTLAKAETELAASLRLVKSGRTTTETGTVTVVAVP